MITHTVVYYESVDGKLFTDDDECMQYEINLLYKNSGVRLYDIQGKIIDKLSFDFYMNSYDVTNEIEIDREKNKENQDFIEALDYYIGWSLISKAVRGTAKRYKIYIDHIEELK